jgi:hypothetical protein
MDYTSLQGTHGGAEGRKNMSRIRATAVGKTFLLILAVVVLAPVVSGAAAKNGFVLNDALVPQQEILSGGPRKDGIPALTKPIFVEAGDAIFLQDSDRVLGISYNGITRAYPIRILNYHEIVNDELGGRAIVVSFCPLCGTGMAFAATVGGKKLVFGVSGLLFNSDVLMYDRQTNSLWSQIMSRAISGPMKGTRLEAISISHTSWTDWKNRHRDTEVLSTETGFRRKYNVDPYPNYSRDGRIFFPVKYSSTLYGRKAVVMGLEINGEFKVYPFDELKKASPRFTDSFQGERFDVLYDEKNKTAKIIDAHDREIPTIMAFWFAWYAFHPESDVFTAELLSDQS